MTNQRIYDSQTVNVAARVACTEAEGPGKRYALWVQGCPLRCEGCCNPHMLPFVEANLTSVDDVVTDIIHAQTEHGIQGVTFIGGEPFTQAGALTNVARRIREKGLSVMVFSGFTKKAIEAKQTPEWDAFLQEIDLLVDGPYIPAKHVEDRRWIGSSNQSIHFLTDRYQHLQQKGWDKGKNTIEIRMKNGEIYINGFPHDDITTILETLAARKNEDKTGAAT